MSSPANFNPEWGYLAPAPSLVRTVRIIAVAAAIGATAGAAVVFSLVDRRGTEESVAARTMAVESPATRAAVVTSVPAQAPEQRPAPPPASSQVGPAVAAESASVTTMARAVNAAALAESPTVTNATAPKGNVGFARLVRQPPQLGARSPAQTMRPLDRGPLALLRSLGGPNSPSATPPGEY